MRNPFFCPAELHGLFEYLGFHRLFAQKALEFANLLIGGTTSSPDATAVSEPS